MWSWLEQLKEPVITKEDVHLLASYGSDLESALFLLEKVNATKSVYIFCFIFFIFKSSCPDPDNDMKLKPFTSTLPKQHETLRSHHIACFTIAMLY